MSISLFVNLNPEYITESTISLAALGVALSRLRKLTNAIIFMARLDFKQYIETTHLVNLILGRYSIVQACIGVPPGCGGVPVYSSGAPEGLIWDCKQYFWAGTHLV